MGRSDGLAGNRHGPLLLRRCEGADTTRFSTLSPSGARCRALGRWARAALVRLRLPLHTRAVRSLQPRFTRCAGRARTRHRASCPAQREHTGDAFALRCSVRRRRAKRQRHDKCARKALLPGVGHPERRRGNCSLLWLAEGQLRPFLPLSSLQYGVASLPFRRSNCGRAPRLPRKPTNRQGCWPPPPSRPSVRTFRSHIAHLRLARASDRLTHAALKHPPPLAVASFSAQPLPSFLSRVPPSSSSFFFSSSTSLPAPLFLHPQEAGRPEPDCLFWLEHTRSWYF